MRPLTTLLFAALFASQAQAQLHISTWNVESGGTDPGMIDKQLRELPRTDVFALQEVAPRDIG
ncbi:MAG: hypothetical protein ACR2NU_17080 [Aeoliella sp.]